MLRLKIFSILYIYVIVFVFLKYLNLLILNEKSLSDGFSPCLSFPMY